MMGGKDLPLGLSQGNRACLMLAIGWRLPAMTADGTRLKSDFGPNMEVIR
jgi:PIN domain nuclease of toxin-antitoxin system